MTRMLGLYVHVPFCMRKCYYCDFASYQFDRVDADLYLRVLPTEISLKAPAVPGARITSLFFGGGTPTTLPGKVIGSIIALLRQQFVFAPGIEITVEANPGTVDPDKLGELRAAGVNRISLGMQAGQDRLLALIGRSHKLADLYSAVEMIRNTGFDNLNLDLIYGLPEQSLDDWRQTLEAALSLGPQHIAAYGLEVHEGTRLADLIADGRLKPCPEDDEVAMYRHLQRRLGEAGFEQYEISNFALPGYACRHNLLYWHNEEYLGFGPAACSYLNGCRQTNHSYLLEYATPLIRRELPIAGQECPDRRVQMAETMFLGLRLAAGVDRKAFASRFGEDPLEAYPGVITGLLGKGLVEVDDHSVRLSNRALPIANEVFSAFV